MQHIEQDLQEETGTFNIITGPDFTPTGILDFGAALGGFISVALRMNPRARAPAITLPLSSEGYRLSSLHAQIHGCYARCRHGR